MFYNIFNYLYNYITNNNDIYNNSCDPNLIKIKNNLKKTITFKKKFYSPNILELKNKIFFRNLKHLHKLNPYDLIEAKNKLKKIN